LKNEWQKGPNDPDPEDYPFGVFTQ